MLDRLLRKRIKNGNNRINHKNGCKVITMPLTSMDDVPLIEMSIETGNVVILSISPLKFNQLIVVKRVVQTLNAFIRKMGGDIAQLGRDYIIVVPPDIELAFPTDLQEYSSNKGAYLEKYEQINRGNLQRGTRSNIGRLSDEIPRGINTNFDRLNDYESRGTLSNVGQLKEEGQRGPRSSIERMKKEIERDKSKSELEQALKDPIFRI